MHSSMVEVRGLVARARVGCVIWAFRQEKCTHFVEDGNTDPI